MYSLDIKKKIKKLLFSSLLSSYSFLFKFEGQKDVIWIMISHFRYLLKAFFVIFTCCQLST